MNQHTLKITASDQPTVLERLLQVSRYRGFTVTGMTMFPSNESKQLDIELSVASEQPVANLEKQLNKLFDILDVNVENKETQQCRA
jgi:acetolactate synthase II small subunit